ncbi:MAG: hypothetical protein Q9M89_09630 [Persephonella sp.]|nr:hypothetical protein [Persephonella sp.]
MRNRYLDVAKIIRSSLKQTKHKELKEYLGRTAISRAYEAVFLELLLLHRGFKSILYSDEKS